MNRMHEHARTLAHRFLHAAAFCLALVALPALAQVDPPARVATLTVKQGAVAWAPTGDTEWLDAVRNRPFTAGDRLWVDEGGRAELHVGSAALQLDSRSLLELTEIDSTALQATLSQGSAVARVRELAAGEAFEIDTPQLALRAREPGEFRIDVDLERQLTRVTVRSGLATVYGANGASRTLVTGEQLAFSGQDLALALGVATLVEDDFDRWAAARNAAEDRSIAARYVPRTVVGYAELDNYGHWATDTTWGPIWYPSVTVVDWAPYRYGHWEWIPPWGWTWIDDAPWGFAPFHYGRWVQVGPRWAWVPGRLGPRPVYAPALVSFVGGAGWSLTVSAGPGIGWYPLAPWEPWRPWYQASPVYVQQVNVVVVQRREPRHFERPPAWFTAMPLAAFEHGQPVPDHRARFDRGPDRLRLAQAPQALPPVLPEGRRFAVETQRPAPLRAAPPSVRSLPPPVAVTPRVPSPLRRFVPAAPQAGLPAPMAASPAPAAAPAAAPATVPAPGVRPAPAPNGPAGAGLPARPGSPARIERLPVLPRPGPQPGQPGAASPPSRTGAAGLLSQPPGRDAGREQAQQRAQQEQQRAQQEQQRVQRAQQAAGQEQQRAAQAQQALERQRMQQEQQSVQQERQRVLQEQQQQRVQREQRAVQEQQRLQRAQEQQRLQREQQGAQAQQRAVQEQQRAAAQALQRQQRELLQQRPQQPAPAAQPQRDGERGQKPPPRQAPGPDDDRKAHP